MFLFFQRRRVIFCYCFTFVTPCSRLISVVQVFFLFVLCFYNLYVLLFLHFSVCSASCPPGSPGLSFFPRHLPQVDFQPNVFSIYRILNFLVLTVCILFLKFSLILAFNYNLTFKGGIVANFRGAAAVASHFGFGYRRFFSFFFSLSIHSLLYLELVSWK